MHVCPACQSQTATNKGQGAKESFWVTALHGRSMGGRATLQLPKGAFITRLRAPVHEGDVESLKEGPPIAIHGERRSDKKSVAPGWVSQYLLRDLATIHGVERRQGCPLTHNKCMTQCPYAWLGCYWLDR
ncbi:hypothetical protein BDA96_04G382900 [Sorghum bicolor]|uniref:Uncharacterized protein n=2 Tax=Sorghum bicolor TaxID=4558 RepID=A0A921R9L0_SORBI|nr:hypothetical protein BDA96_04G382900 [Sorghum bicolor]OQU86022.1 hypothetical protein SORBI_3004G357066 [Sorghum bicolor]